MSFRDQFRTTLKAASPPIDSFVSWTGPSGQVSRGKVVQSFTSGTIKPSARSPGFLASQAAPVIEIELYEQKAGGWEPSGDKVIRPARACMLVADLRRPISFTGFKFKQGTDSSAAEIVIYGDIGSSMMSLWGDDDSSVGSNDIREALAEIPLTQDIDIRVNSTGGDAFEGMTIYNLLAQRAKKTNCKLTGYNDGVCASAATVVMCACNRVVAGQQSLYMIHRGWTMAVGDVNDLQKSIELLSRIDDQTIDLYLAFANARGKKMKREDVAAMVDKETWMDAGESVQNGFADEIFETRGMIAQSYGAQRPWMSDLPEALKGKFSAANGKFQSRVPSLPECAEATEMAV